MSPSELSSADSRIVILLLFECETDSPIDGWIAKIAKIAKVVPLRLCLECFTFAAVRATRRSPAPAPGGQDGASDRCCGGEQEGTRRLREEREREGLLQRGEVWCSAAFRGVGGLHSLGRRVARGARTFREAARRSSSGSGGPTRRSGWLSSAWMTPASPPFCTPSSRSTAPCHGDKATATRARRGSAPHRQRRKPGPRSSSSPGSRLRSRTVRAGRPSGRHGWTW